MFKLTSKQQVILGVYGLLSESEKEMFKCGDIGFIEIISSAYSHKKFLVRKRYDKSIDFAKWRLQIFRERCLKNPENITEFKSKFIEDLGGLFCKRNYFLDFLKWFLALAVSVVINRLFDNLLTLLIYWIFSN